ncbi:hypothetical protein Smp_163540 [Schistosoma mansoni]|nr:hypothetical protein Smp_163540 [Schistosoma mansoni]|eukprot:XP_018645932.1 hypothetical protein Smp_163540 [Schistosoma mansoni]
MSTVTLRWIGDLDQDKREQAGCVSSSSDQYRPKKIELKPGQKEIRIGRINTKIPPDYPIESCINSRMISRNHATIERSAKGGSILYDHSMNGTYVNYTRVMGGVTLKHGDIVCFGHLNGANLKPGEPVALFYSDLKYRVELSDSPTKENVVTGTTKKRKSYPAQPGSTVSSTQRSDGEDDSIGSSDESTDAKRPRSNTTSSAQRTANRQKFKKPASSNRHKVDEEDDEDSNEDPDDSSSNKRLSSAGSKTIKKRSNGTDKIKKSHSNSVSRKSSGTKPGHTHNKEKRRSGKSSKSGGFDAEDDAGGGDMFHYDSEECSARPCKQPQDIAIDWIQCDRCTLWYHQDVIESYLELKLHSLRSSDPKSINPHTVTKVPPPHDRVNLSNNISKSNVVSTPLPSSIFYEPWHSIWKFIRMNPIYGIGGKTLPPKCILFMDPKYIPPIHSLSKIDNANLPSSTALDYCYEALLFMTQAYETVVRVTLFKDSKTENGEFMCNCDPYLNLPCHFGITELTSMGDFVKQHIWSSICKQFSADE